MSFFNTTWAWNAMIVVNECEVYTVLVPSSQTESLYAMY